MGLADMPNITISFRRKDEKGIVFAVLDDTSAGVTVIGPFGLFFVTCKDANESAKSGDWFRFSDEIPELKL
jgi:hypothetical protein